MRITEAQIRRIIREELENVMDDKMSILPPDVSPELFAKAFKTFEGPRIKRYANLYNSDPDFVKDYIVALTRPNDYTGKSDLTQQQAEEALKLVEMCVKGEQYEFGYGEITAAIRNLFKKTSDNAILSIYGQYFNGGLNTNTVLTRILYSPAFTMTHITIAEMKNDLNAEYLQTQIDILNSLKAFTEPKQLSRSTILKLKKMSYDADGLLQAAELYSLL